MDYAERLKSLRQELGLTQKELADRANLAISCISMIELGKREPSANTLLSLSNALGVSADYLLGLEDDFGHKTSDDVIKRPQYDITDKQLQDLVKLFGVMTELQKAHVIGYIIAYLEREGINVGKVLGY